MSDATDERLIRFVEWVTTLSHDEAVRRCRTWSDDDRLLLGQLAHSEATAALTTAGATPDPAELEPLARSLEVLADANTEDPRYEHERFLRKAAAHLRNPQELRARAAEEAARTRLSEGRLQSMALTSSCWADATTEVRLRRIEEVLPLIRQLADQARAEGREGDIPAFGEDIASLWKLRESLKSADDA